MPVWPAGICAASFRSNRGALEGTAGRVAGRQAGRKEGERPTKLRRGSQPPSLPPFTGCTLDYPLPLYTTVSFNLHRGHRGRFSPAVRLSVSPSLAPTASVPAMSCMLVMRTRGMGVQKATSLSNQIISTPPLPSPESGQLGVILAPLPAIWEGFTRLCLIFPSWLQSKLPSKLVLEGSSASGLIPPPSIRWPMPPVAPHAHDLAPDIDFDLPSRITRPMPLYRG